MSADGRRETIFAPASGIGRAAVSIIRISGSRSESVIRALLKGRLPAPRHASLRRLHDPVSSEFLDEALVLWMPGPGTFTGEDSAEFQLHGSPAVRAAMLRSLSALPGCRAAEPGEFTRRAFLNGRLDLTAVEGLADLIDAETEAQRRQALRQLGGGLARQVESWRSELVDALAACEASLDFADEGDVPESVASGVIAAVQSVAEAIASALALARRGERVRDGFQVVIAGPPNAGKSTLLNTFAGRDVAIVSPVPGTTRDAIEVRCDLGGLPVTFMDTAGLHDSDDEIEREGMARARNHASQADLVLWLTPSGSGTEGPPPEFDRIPLVTVATKTDLTMPLREAELAISAKTGYGIDSLLARIGRTAEEAMESGADALLTRERHSRILIEAAACLDRAVRLGQGRDPEIELLAEDIRLALRHLGRMTGVVDVEEILDRIFASFCIGK